MHSLGTQLNYNWNNSIIIFQVQSLDYFFEVRIFCETIIPTVLFLINLLISMQSDAYHYGIFTHLYICGTPSLAPLLFLVSLSLGFIPGPEFLIQILSQVNSVVLFAGNSPFRPLLYSLTIYILDSWHTLPTYIHIYKK